MADLSDVLTFMASAVATAVYPNGTSQPSIIAAPVKIYEGWPIAGQLDCDMAGTAVAVGGGTKPNGIGPISNVSIYPMNDASPATYQNLDEFYTVAPPVHGLSVMVSVQTATFTGEPNPGEFVTIIVDGVNVYSSGGATLAAILASIQSSAAAQYPTATITSNSITIGGHALTCRIGASGTMARATHRQKNSIMITVWTPDPITRGRLASAIDVAIKADYRTVTFPDTSMGLVIYARTIQPPKGELDSYYRRDLIYSVEYATLDTFQAVEVTTVGVSGNTVPPGYSPVTATT